MWIIAFAIYLVVVGVVLHNDSKPTRRQLLQAHWERVWCRQCLMNNVYCCPEYLKCGQFCARYKR